MRTVTIFWLIVSLLLTGCYFKKVYTGDAIVRPSTKYKYEIQFPIRYYGRGNLHNPFDFKYFEGMMANWMYVNSLESTVHANDLIFTYYWACSEYPWIEIKLEGHIEFKDGNISISLGRSGYDEKGKLRYWPLEINGTYKLQHEKQPYIPSRNELISAPCDRTGIPIPQELIIIDKPCNRTDVPISQENTKDR